MLKKNFVAFIEAGGADSFFQTSIDTKCVSMLWMFPDRILLFTVTSYTLEPETISFPQNVTFRKHPIIMRIEEGLTVSDRDREGKTLEQLLKFWFKKSFENEKETE
jgi:hypothetical protein